MLTVTTTAKEKLEEVLTKKGADPEKTIRFTISVSKENDLDFIWDKERKDDFVVKNEEGRTVLVIKPDLAKSLDGMALDYRETPQGVGFTVKKITPDT